MKWTSIHVDSETYRRLTQLRRGTGKTYTGVILALMRAYDGLPDKARADAMFDTSSEPLTTPSGSDPGG